MKTYQVVSRGDWFVVFSQETQEGPEHCVNGFATLAEAEEEVRLCRQEDQRRAETMKHRGETVLELGRCITCRKFVRQPYDGRCRRCFVARGGLVIDQPHKRRRTR